MQKSISKTIGVVSSLFGFPILCEIFAQEQRNALVTSQIRATYRERCPASGNSPFWRYYPTPFSMVMSNSSPKEKGEVIFQMTSIAEQNTESSLKNSCKQLRCKMLVRKK
mmetsp:Transcript_24842/g.37521  ORF Transcript_24842/g.37521 Transcript_24842/m.37521 type:complete len:110 (+) Transcript_24842:787-1116(+)